MIDLHLINDSQIILNSDLIEFIEATPDTVISLSNGKKMIVKESVSEVVDKVIEFRRRVNVSAQNLAGSMETKSDRSS